MDPLAGMAMAHHQAQKNNVQMARTPAGLFLARQRCLASTHYAATENASGSTGAAALNAGLAKR